MSTETPTPIEQMHINAYKMVEAAENALLSTEQEAEEYSRNVVIARRNLDQAQASQAYWFAAVEREKSNG